VNDDDIVEPQDGELAGDDEIEVIDTDELVTEPQGDTGSSPNGLLQNRLVKVDHPQGVEQGEDNWTKGQLVRRLWERS
jgi:hypothetical protein